MSHLNEQIEEYFLEIINGDRRSRGAAFWRFVLSLLSKIFESIVLSRLYLYRHGIFRHYTLGCQVVSVGNLTVGGTGKTPIVEIFARSLAESGRKVAILSRGYKKEKPPLRNRVAAKFRGTSRTAAPLVVSDGKRLLMGSGRAGDEPYMLASNLPKAAVLVDANRVKSGRYAIKALGCDTLILDDGFQHLKLKHWVDIVLVDSTNPFGNNGRVLPRGLLREPIRNIKRAHFIFITKCSGPQKELKAQLRALNSHAEISECRHCPRYLENVYTGERFPLEYLEGKRVAAMSGIASPDGFENELCKFGAELVDRKRYADHHRYTQMEILDRINKSIERGAEIIVTTEKDAVRLPKIKRRDISIYFLRVEIELLTGKEDFEALIRRICFK
ncbi:MAG: tetraacyldisaccharide 4'-kinase [Spartobacteria bacterium]|nr:tetraacyldisaccharide 4'-kinase [Spartobacteria bacterium]